MQDKELSLVIWSWGVLLGVIGSLVMLAGSLSYYLFRKHREDNDCDHHEIKETISEIRSEVKEDINRIHERIDSVLIGE